MRMHLFFAFFWQLFVLWSMVRGVKFRPRSRPAGGTIWVYQKFLFYLQNQTLLQETKEKHRNLTQSHKIKQKKLKTLTVHPLIIQPLMHFSLGWYLLSTVLIIKLFGCFLLQSTMVCIIEERNNFIIILHWYSFSIHRLVMSKHYTFRKVRKLLIFFFNCFLEKWGWTTAWTMAASSSYPNHYMVYSF